MKLSAGEPVYRTNLTSGHHWSLYMRRGHTLTMQDVRGGLNVGMLFYNAQLLHEKYNAPDTLKCQHTFQISRGHCLYSDMGRIFCSVVGDEFGGHDTVCGNINADMVSERWPPRSYQLQSNDWTQNGYDSFLTELAKYGLGPRHMAANLNWFSRVVVDDAGNMTLAAAESAGTSLSLRFEMDTLVVLHTCPHPMDGSSSYPAAELKLAIARAAPVAADDLCLNHCDENRRGFRNNALYHMEPAL